MSPFKEAISGKEVCPHDVVFPVLASLKLDGVRATVVQEPDGTIFLASRSRKKIANYHIQKLLSAPEYVGLDGELIVGDVVAEDVCRKTTSACNSFEGAPEFTFYVFDKYDAPGGFESRYAQIPEGLPYIKRVAHGMIRDIDGLNRTMSKAVKQGYEGLILRAPDGPYKFGKSSLKEGYLLKMKPWKDSEARIIEVIEAMENTNGPETNEVGRTKRSKAKGGMVPKGTMGKLLVEDIYSGVRFKLGVAKGMTAAMRKDIWTNQDHYIGQLVKYKSMAVGEKDKPRQPVWLGFRPDWDLPACNEEVSLDDV